MFLEVPDEPKDNSGSSSSSFYGSDAEVQDVFSDEENKADENKVDAEVVEKQAGNEQLTQVLSPPLYVKNAFDYRCTYAWGAFRKKKTSRVLRVFGRYTTRLLHAGILIPMRLEESLVSTQEKIAGSSEGSGMFLEVPDEPKDNSGSSSSSIFRADDEVQDVSSDEENKADAEDPAVQRTPLIDTIISMVTEKTTILTQPTTQAQVTNVSKSDSSSKLEHDGKTDYEKLGVICWWKDKRYGLQTTYANNLTLLFCPANIEV
nr:hypothetical protein [Tanacetum cinerariifolium]